MAVSRMRRNMATLDEKTGEIVFDNLRIGQLVVTRWFLINKEDCYIRCIEIVKNTTGQDQNANLMIASSMNYGIDAGQFVTDPKKKRSEHCLGSPDRWWPG